MADKITPIHVANEFIRLAQPRGLSNLALQKLSYIAHGWHLAVTGKPLVEEQVSAWKYGPVFRSLYHVVKEHNDGRVTEPLQTLESAPEETGVFPFRFVAPEIPATATDAKNAIKHVWKKYGSLSAFELKDLTHQKGTPWDIVTDAAFAQYGVGFWDKVRDLKIPNELIEKHYLDLWKSKSSASAG